MTQSKSSGYLLAGVIISMLGAVLFSTKAVVVKLAYREYPVDAITLLAIRMIFSLPFFLISAAVSSGKKENARFTPRQWAMVALVGCLGYYISSLLDFEGLQFIPAGIERLILFIYPTFVLLISAWWFKKKVRRIEWAAVAITYVGLMLAFFNDAKINSHDPMFYWGSLLIFICAITYAAYIAGSGALIPTIGAMKFNSYAMTFAAIGVITHFLITSSQSVLGLPWIIYAYGIFMAIVGTVIPSYLISISIKRLGSNTTGIIASVGPVSTILQAYFLLGEPITVVQLIGTAFILGGVLLISWKPAADSASNSAA